MRLREWMADFAVKFAKDNSHGYTNDYPDNQWWRGSDLDCGSFMSYVLHMALLKTGIDTGYVYFEPQGGWSIYNEVFLLKYCDRYNYADEYDKVGDILVSGGHTEMVTSLNPKKLTGARNDYDGKAGDWTYGNEIATSDFFTASGGWHYIYRLKEIYNKEVDVEPTEEGWDMSKIPTVKEGDVNDTVLSYQYLLRYKLGYDKQTCDGVFGSQTAYNVRDFQRDHGLYEDAIIGELTGRAIISETGYEEP